MTTDAAVEVDELVVRYDDVVAVDGLSFTAARGEIVALLGPNGAGKTSTVETLEGFRRPSGGSVRVLGLDPVADHARVVDRIGVMLQQGGVYTAMRPPEALRLFASYYDDPADPDELLHRVGLDAQRGTPWRHLSGGEKQRLSLALALVGRPAVAFLDEPTAGIDPAGRQTIRSLVAELRGEDVCVLLTTHDLDEGEYLVAGAPSPTTVAAITSWLAARDIPLADLRAGRPTLEDVFLRLTESAAIADASSESTSATDGRGGRRTRRRR
jgi:ABC-2 type transport system ATP-binding protein